MLTGYLTRPPAPDRRLRLFCLHHAGGAASAYADWDGELGDEVDLLPIQLPGREGRIGEPRLRRMDTLVEQLIAELGGYLRPPYALYGHSMGALVAYALTEALHARGHALPEQVLVGAYPAPDQHRFIREVPGMSPEELTQLLLRIGGMSDLVLRYPAWRDAATGLTRDDLLVCHSYTPGPVPVPCDLHAFAGDRDPLMALAEAAGWVRYTDGRFRLHRVPGGHFFVRDARTEFFTTLRTVLGLPPRAAVPSGRAGFGARSGAVAPVHRA